MCVTYHEERQYDFVEHKPRDQEGQIPQNVLALALLGGVVELEEQDPWFERPSAVFVELGMQHPMESLDGNV